jgi:hypothetical protein
VKTPAGGIAADRFDDAFLDQFVDAFGRQPAGVTQFDQRQFDVIFQYFTG